MKILFIGDVHGKNKEYLKIINSNKFDISVQLGDFGFGFGHDFMNIPENNYFIRGNHDEPDICRSHPNYLGDWGYSNNMFFISGGYSIDKEWRMTYEAINGIKIWWEEEEIGKKEYKHIYKMYENIKPNLVISHECPKFVVNIMNNELKKYIFSNTSDILLPKIFEIHKPKTWVFAHHHRSFNENIDGTQFICLKELETLLLEV